MNNNNRGNNNRRRGRTNTRPQGGGQQVNRVDSRARGNAPQMLEKYRKQAQDAHLNGDRVTAEYYLQFADHYFRVIADTRVRQDEQRRPRDENWQENTEEGEDNAEFAVESDFPSYDQPNFARPREDRPRDERPRDERPRDDRPRDERPRDERPRDERPRDDRPRDDRPRDDRPRDDRTPRRREEREPRADETVSVQASEGSDEIPVSESAGPAFEPVENPFVRDNRGTRGLRPRREDRRPRRDDDASPEAATGNVRANGTDEPAFDASLLPPSIKIGENAPVASVADDEAPAAPKRRGRKPKAEAEASDEA